MTIRRRKPCECPRRSRFSDVRRSARTRLGPFCSMARPDGLPHEQFVADEALQGDPAPICAQFAADGLQIVRARQREFVNYLSGVETKARVTVVHRTGWHEIDADKVFVLPGENIGGKGVGRVLLDGAAHGPYDVTRHDGRMARWRRVLSGRPRDADADNVRRVRWVAVVPERLGGGGLNLFGQSSRGKTTCLQAAASVWGRGETDGGYVQTWRATANGLEGTAAQSTDTVMMLDELGMADAASGTSVYGLANGQGKQRASRDGSARKPKSCRVLYLSSGELTVDAKLAETPGRKARAGQLVRLLDVPADRGVGFGVFDDPGPDGDAAALAKSIKLAATWPTERPARHLYGD